MAKTSFKRQATARKEPIKKITVTYKQGLFIQCNADMVLFGGAAGGGKSYAQLIDALYCADNYPGIRQLILRESFPELRRSLIIKSQTLYPEDRMQYNAADFTWYHINGSIIEFGYLDSDDSVTIYKSAEYDIIRPDEGTEFSEYRLTYMQSRIRGANKYPKQMKISTNPDGPGHKFLKKTFKIGVNEPYVTFQEYIGKDRFGKPQYESRCYIPSLYYDNDFLMDSDPGYVNRLLKLPEKEQKALMEGNWEIFDDQAFPEFDYKIHVVNGQKLFPGGIPPHWKRWRSVDPGYDDPFAWYWFTVDERGTVYIYREFTREKGDKFTQIREKEQAQKVAEKSKYSDEQGGEHDEKFSFTVAGRDAWATNHRDEQGKTLVDLYNDGGVYGFIPAVTDRRLRKRIWHEYLAPYEIESGVKTAKLQIFDTCKVLIEKLPEMLKDPDDNEKVLDVDDHQYDGAGYGLIAYHASKSKRSESEKSEIEKDMERLWRSQRQRRIS